MFTGELFEVDDVDRADDRGRHRRRCLSAQAAWDDTIGEVLAEATLKRPADGWMISGGRRGAHTEHLGHMLAADAVPAARLSWSDMVMPQAADQNEPVRAAGAGGASVERARAALDQVTDPELPFLTIADMGILRDVRVAGDGLIEVDITPTYSGCPATDVIAARHRRRRWPRPAVEQCPRPQCAVAGLDHRLAERRRAREAARQWHRAARARRAASARCSPAVEVACPACGSAATERVSEFGSTACKAHYRCRDCREPFEYFKCI